jgi:hypothetical protein
MMSVWLISSRDGVKGSRGFDMKGCSSDLYQPSMFDPFKFVILV